MNLAALSTASDHLRDEIHTAETAKNYELARTLNTRRLSIIRQINDEREADYMRRTKPNA